MSTFLSRVIPAHFQDPFGLAMRALRSGGPEGRFALLSVLLGLIASPLDILLQPFETRLYRRQDTPHRPMVLVCGPARSGTSVVASSLIRALPVGYINNLMALFPRSPLVASRLFGVDPQNEKVGSKTYYGRTNGFAAQNDGLFLWDRWLGQDRTNSAPELTAPAGSRLSQFWAALEEHCERPIVAKNNSLIVCADAVARYLPNAHFLCLRREPIYLAQSLLIARNHIHGDSRIPYGLHGAERDDDPVRDVCQQVWFYEQAAQTQLEALGADRFWVVSYEEFCQDPRALVNRVAKQIFDWDIRNEDLGGGLSPFTASTKRRVPAETFEKIADGLRALGIPCSDSGSCR